MRILHCAPFKLERYCYWYPSIEQKLSNGLIRLGHSVEMFAYREVARREGVLGHKFFGLKAVNRKLIEACANYEPQVLLLGHAELIENATVEEIRRRVPGIRVALWYCDPLWVPEKIALVKRWARVCDAVFVTSGGEVLAEIAREGALTAHFPNPVDASIESGQAFDAKEWDHDLFFAGIEKGEPGRTAFLTQLREGTPGLRFRIHKAFGEPPIGGRAYIGALERSMMGLNLSRRWDVPWYSSDRIAHMMGSGMLTLTPRTPGLTTLFSADAMGWFDGFADLRELISHYQTRPEEARAVAKRGWAEMHAKCDGRIVASWILALTRGETPQTDVAWAGEVARAGGR
ncbi:MAG: glycosyltransferase family 1 protein [Burkholderiales bacterium]|nr:glycosyltransferase family 1 protein [Opitutaceae bacterium]